MFEPVSLAFMDTRNVRLLHGWIAGLLVKRCSALVKNVSDSQSWSGGGLLLQSLGGFEQGYETPELRQWALQRPVQVAYPFNARYAGGPRVHRIFPGIFVDHIVQAVLARIRRRGMGMRCLRRRCLSLGFELSGA